MAHAARFEHSGLFVARTPLLPIDELVGWAEGLRAPAAAAEGDDAALDAALAHDRARLLAWLRAKARRPEVREALFVASPSLDDAVSAWLDDEASPRAANVPSILVRYLTRLASRPTPFGLFSACAVGTVVPGGGFAHAPGPRFVRHTRLDMEYLSALADALERQPDLRAALRFGPNTSLYERAGQVRYIEARVDPAARERVNDLVAIEATPALRETLERARGGATAGELARALVATRPDVAEDDAAAFVDSLVESRALVSELAPRVTGPGPLDDAIAVLAAAPPGRAAAQALARARDALAAIDRDGVGLPPARYRTVAEALHELPAPVELPRLFHVDLYRPDGEATLGERVLDEIGRAVELLTRISEAPDGEALKRFRERFAERYEGRTVPLVDALDEELGVGFPLASGPSADPAPLLQAADLPTRPDGATPAAFGAADAHKLRRLLELIARGENVWALDDADVEALAHEPLPLPDAFVAMATLAAESPEAVARGDYAFALRAAGGPSGARLFGRFCHGAPGLRAAVEAHLRAEEALRPDAIFAEIVHLPQGRLGNILCRPPLRAYEIAYLARPGVDPAHALPITDLLVGLERGRIVVRSQRLGREIVPRLTSAHAVGPRDLPIYRFLTALQTQDGTPSLGWSWGPLASAPRLPRVVRGRAVLSPARWALRKADLEPLAWARGAQRFRAADGLRRRLDLPRWLSVGQGDQRLAIDLDNALSVDALAELARGRDELSAQELYPPPEGACVRGEGGRYAHEIAVPFVRRATAPTPEARPQGDAGPPPAAPASEARPQGDTGPPPAARPPEALPPPEARPDGGTLAERVFVPGSEWLTVKCYAGAAGVDRLLCEVAAPAVEAARAEGLVDRWFFVRYGDPAWHLRLRFHGAGRALLGQLLPDLHDRLAPFVGGGVVSRVQVDTYQRETERYGGREAIAAAEEIFFHDSEASLAIVEMLEGDDGAEARWRLTLRGTHDLLVDFGLALDERHALARRLREQFGAEQGAGAAAERKLGELFRRERAHVAELLAASGDGEHPLAAGVEALERRSAAIAPAVARLRDLERRGALSTPLPSVIASVAHMFANRLLLSQQRPQELVIHDLLARHYGSELGRARAAARRG
ncbi:MAG TPA: lantibiotic dehydratase [Polyangiaceae bacterium]|nr:lantibiotic dehydratase [Polyangiaceae bacterium]